MLQATITLMLLGFVFGTGLAFASRVLAVERDERIEAIDELLPGANCGACGYPGCSAFAEALVKGEGEIQNCPVSDSEARKKIAEILGQELGEEVERQVAKVHCHGGEAAKTSFKYVGIEDCEAAASVAGGPKACEYGCLGFGNCEAACDFDAIHMGPDGLPVVDEEKCTGCGECVEACPRDLIEMVPESRPINLLCSAPYGPRESRAVCSNSCIACRLCERECPVDAITMENNLPVIDYNECLGCGVCVRVCPTDALELVPPKDMAEKKRASAS